MTHEPAMGMVALGALLMASMAAWVCVRLCADTSARAAAAHRGPAPPVTETDRQIVFSAPTRPAELLDRIRSTVSSRARRPGIDRLRLVRQDYHSLTYMLGNRGRTALTYLVVTATNGAGCVGRAGVAGWIDGDGARADEEATRITTSVLDAISTLGGSWRAAADSTISHP